MSGAIDFKAKVRRRNASDDDGCGPDDLWPNRFTWVVDIERHDPLTGEFLGGCDSPFTSFEAALAAACQEADDVRASNIAATEPPTPMEAP